MMNRFKTTLFLVLLSLMTVELTAQVKLPTVLSDNAVLQQSTEVLLWGTGEPNKNLTVSPSWTSKRYTTKIGANGEWELPVETIEAGGPYSISFNDGKEVVINNILLGEVWFCFGQSNMRMVMKGNGKQPVEGSADAIMLADQKIPLRYYRSANQWSVDPKSDIEGSWGLNSPKDVATYGATPYFFALYLQKALDVPVGIVECAWGGSRIESWMSREMLKAYDPNYKIEQDDSNDSAVAKANHCPTLLYNGILEPLRNVKFKGAIWYQGEANLDVIDEYCNLFEQFATSLRRDHFNCGDFPIYYAQLAPHTAGQGNGFVLMREAMTEIMHRVPKTGMVVLSDIGESLSIHPRNKQDVGKRFAYWALGDTYGRDHIEYRAPEFNSMTQLEANDLYPKRVALNFKYAQLGLSFGDEHGISVNFEVAGEDRIFYPATVRLGWSKNHLEVWSDQVEDIVAVRYGFKNFFIGDVYNNFGIPISSFRTDNWDLE